MGRGAYGRRGFGVQAAGVVDGVAVVAVIAVIAPRVFHGAVIAVTAVTGDEHFSVAVIAVIAVTLGERRREPGRRGAAEECRNSGKQWLRHMLQATGYRSNVRLSSARVGIGHPQIGAEF